MAQLKAGTTIGGRNIVQELDSHKNDYVRQMAYAVADGVNTYTVSIPGITSLVEGLSVKVKFQNANTGPSTLNINGLGAKEIRKSNGNVLSAGNIKAGQICHLVYNGVNFQLLGEGGEYGNVTPDKVLEGTTFGTEEGLKEGTMPNQGKVIITPGTTNIIIPRGFHNGEGYVEGSPNLSAENIKEGVNIFGVVGTLKEALVYTSETYYETIADGQYVDIYCPFIPDYFRVIVANQPLPSQYEGRKIFYMEWCHRADLVIDPYLHPNPTLGYFSQEFFKGSPNAIDMEIGDWGSWQLVEGQYRNRLRFRLGIPAILNNCYVYLVAIKGI